MCGLQSVGALFGLVLAEQGQGRTGCISACSGVASSFPAHHSRALAGSYGRQKQILQLPAGGLSGSAADGHSACAPWHGPHSQALVSAATNRQHTWHVQVGIIGTCRCWS